ncbi:hypothetical protein C0J52_01868, partial [Blattella germanica]
VEGLSRHGQDLQQKTLLKSRKEQSKSIPSTHFLRRNVDGQHPPISRYPGDGIGSPGTKEELEINKLHSLSFPQNENKIQIKLQKIKQPSDSRTQKCHPSRSVDHLCSARGKKYITQRSNSGTK